MAQHAIESCLMLIESKVLLPRGTVFLFPALNWWKRYAEMVIMSLCYPPEDSIWNCNPLLDLDFCHLDKT